MTNKTGKIHKTAIIEDGAQIGADVVVGPYCVIGPQVTIEDGTKLHSHVVVNGNTKIGKNNEVFSFAAIGNTPQDLKYNGENTTLEIGDNNSIRESVTIHLGTVQGIGTTKIGNNNLIMAYTHIAHDCVIGNSVILANNTQIAGHITIRDMAIVAGFTALHQFVRVGEMAMIQGCSCTNQDVPPYCIAGGSRKASLAGLNLVALKRKGVPSQVRSDIYKTYKIMFMSGHPTTGEASDQVKKEGLYDIPEVKNFVDFIMSSERGVVRPSERVYE